MNRSGQGNRNNQSGQNQNQYDRNNQNNWNDQNRQQTQSGQYNQYGQDYNYSQGQSQQAMSTDMNRSGQGNRNNQSGQNQQNQYDRNNQNNWNDQNRQTQSGQYNQYGQDYNYGQGQPQQAMSVDMNRSGQNNRNNQSRQNQQDRYNDDNQNNRYSQNQQNQYDRNNQNYNYRQGYPQQGYSSQMNAFGQDNRNNQSGQYQQGMYDQGNQNYGYGQGQYGQDNRYNQFGQYQYNPYGNQSYGYGQGQYGQDNRYNQFGQYQYNPYGYGSQNYSYGQGQYGQHNRYNQFGQYQYNPYVYGSENYSYGQGQYPPGYYSQEYPYDSDGTIMAASGRSGKSSRYEMDSKSSDRRDRKDDDRSERRDMNRDDAKWDQISRLNRIAESLVAQEQYSAANAVYAEILTLDPNNWNAKNRLKQTDSRNRYSSARSNRIYDFRTTNPRAFSSTLGQIGSELNKYATENDSGRIDFNFYIRYDTSGVNRSSYEYNGGELYAKSDKKLKRQFTHFLRELSTSSTLTPSRKDGIMVASQSTIGVDFSWSTKEAKFRRNDARMLMRTDSDNPADLSAITSFLEREGHHTGTYFFDIKQKNLNQMTYTDVNLRKFRTVGPEAMLYSMIIPGSGNLAATQGQKGWVTLPLFLVFGAGALVSYFAYDNEIKEARKHPTGSDNNQRHVNNSNTFRYIGYACIGLGGAVYLADVFTALGRGIKNAKASRELRKSLRESPIPVQRESIAVY